MLLRLLNLRLVPVLAVNLLATAVLAAPPAAAPPTKAPPTKAPATVAAPAKPATPTPPAPTKPWGKLTSGSGQTWELLKPEITVGSDTTCDVVLTDPTIAPKHFRLTFAAGNAAVDDLGSKMGTLVAGTAVKSGKPFKVLNAVEIDPGAVTLQFTFLERGTIAPSQPPRRAPAPKLKPSTIHK